MASILRSTRLVYSLKGFSRQINSLTSKKKKILLNDCRGTYNFNELKIRAVAVAAQKQIQQENYVSFERLIYQLSVDLKRQHVSRNDFESAFEALKQKGELKYPHLILLLKCCSEVSFTRSEEDRIEMAKNIWKVAEDFGTEFNIGHYNVLLEVFIINHHKFSPAEFWDSLKIAGVQPNFETYRLLLRAYCSQGDIEGAGSILNHMKQMDLPLNREDFNSLIQGYCEIGDLEKADEILQVMEERKIKPCSDSYVNLLCGYAKHGRIDELKIMLNELPGKNIFFSDSELLEIIYTLAINNHDQHVDIILEKLLKEKGYVKLVTRYIVRLFEKRKNSVALKLYKTTSKVEDENNIPLSVKCVLDFFSSYRDPKEILDICNKLVEKENFENALHYSLNACFQARDENFFVNFLEVMKAQGIKVKKHYYWPAIIRASKKGNSEIYSILNRTSNVNLLKDRDTLLYIILRNFTFDNDWKVDLENFIKMGANVELVTKYLLDMFLAQNKLKEAEYLVSSYPVRINNLTLLLENLFKNIENNLDENERVVNILYYLAHDLKNEKFLDDENQKMTQDTDKKSLNIFDTAVQVLLKFSFSEEVKRDILQKMLEKKMRLFNSSSINESTNLNDLIGKLKDPNLEFEWDNKIIEKKNNFAKVLQKSNRMKDEIFSNEDSLKEWIRKSNFASLDEFVLHMLNLADQKNFEGAVKIAEHLLFLGKEIQNADKTRQLYKKFLSKGIQNNKEPALLEKAFDLGIKLGVLQMRDFSTVIRSYLRSNDVSMAVEKFCDHALYSGELSGCIELLRELIIFGKNEDVDKITNFVTNLTSKEISFSFLFAALVNAQEMDKAHQLLKNENLELDRSLIKRHCTIWSKTENSEFFEKLFDVLKDLKNFDRKLLYKILVQKYIEENRLDAIKDLSLQMEQDIFLNDKFRNEMAEFIKNPNIDVFNQIFDNASQGTSGITIARNTKKKQFWHFMEKQDYDQAFSLIMSNEVPSFLAAALLDAFASQGNVSKVLELLNVSRLERYTKRAAVEFLKAGKIDEFFLFLTDFIVEGKINRFSDFYKLFDILPNLRKDDAFLKKYKSFALQCLEDANFATPLISYFVECVRIPEKVKEAENIFEQYGDHLKKTTFDDISSIADATEEFDFYENLLSSKKLKSHFSENLTKIYNKVISMKLKANNIDCAIRYLEMAEADGVKEHLNKNMIVLLNKKLSEDGKNISSENSEATSN